MKKSKFASAVTTLAITFNSIAAPAQSQVPALTVQSAQSAVVESRDPYAPVTKEEQKYVDIKGNEFVMIIKTRAYPEGKKVMIDPDDMMPINHPVTGRVILIPRQRMMLSINEQLPAVAGEQIPVLKPGEAIGVDGAQVTKDRLHLVGDGPTDHDMPIADLDRSMMECYPRRGITLPAPTPSK